MKSFFIALTILSLFFSTDPRSIVAQMEWTTPTLINTDMFNINDSLEAYNSLKPAHDGNGNVLAAWFTYEKTTDDNGRFVIKLAKSSTGGRFFTGGKTVVSHCCDSFDYLHVVHAGQGKWVVCYTQEESLESGNESNIYVITSLDGGNSWSQPKRVSLMKGAGIYNRSYSMASNSNGTVIICTDHMMIRSKDFGETWQHHPVNYFSENSSGVGDKQLIYTVNNKWVCSCIERTNTTHTLNAILSHDNGLTWDNVIQSNLNLKPDGNNYLSSDDLTFHNNTILFAFTVYKGTFYSVDHFIVFYNIQSGTWSDIKTVPNTLGDIGSYSNMKTTSDGNRVLCIMDIGTFESTDLETWTPIAETTTNGDYINYFLELFTLPNGRLSCILRPFSSMVSGVTSEPLSLYDIKLESTKPPKFSVNKKSGELMVKWKLSASNLGPGKSEDTMVGLWLISDQTVHHLHNLKGLVRLKPIKAAKPGKKPKAKKVTISGSLTPVNDESLTHISAVIMQGFGEEGYDNNRVDVPIPGQE